jgi:hypothetical protein
MPSVAFNYFMLNVIRLSVNMLAVVMPSVVAPAVNHRYLRKADFSRHSTTKIHFNKILALVAGTIDTALNRLINGIY